MKVWKQNALLVVAAASLAALASIGSLTDHRIPIPLRWEAEAKENEPESLGTVRLISDDSKYKPLKRLCEYADGVKHHNTSYVTVSSVADDLEEITYSEGMFIQVAGPATGKFNYQVYDSSLDESSIKVEGLRVAPQDEKRKRQIYIPPVPGIYYVVMDLEWKTDTITEIYRYYFKIRVSESLAISH